MKARPTPTTPKTPRDFLEEFKAMCRDAGITDEALEKAWEGRFIPYGVFGDEVGSLSSKQNNQLYFDDELDARRGKIRKLVFELADIELRKRLIKKMREFDNASEAMTETDIASKQQELRKAKDNLTGGYYWIGPAILGVAAVAVGYRWFKVPGAIAGAVVAFFYGQHEMFKARTQMQAHIETLESEVQDLQQSEADDRLQPSYFSSGEARTGQEDQEFGGESAFVNRMTHFRKES
jgi:hypothetical protein